MFLNVLRLAIAWFGVMSCAVDHSAVFERSGGIMLKRPTGEIVALTSSGRDSEPFITDDGKTVVFCRRDATDQFCTSVLTVDPQSRVEKVLFEGPVTVGSGAFDYLGSPQIDAQGRTLYLIVRHSVTTGTLVAVDLRTKAVREVTEAVAYDLIRSGTYKGDLLVYQRHHTLVGIPYYYYVYQLYDPNGKDLGIAGPDKLDEAEVRCPGIANDSVTPESTDDRAQRTPGARPVQVSPEAMAAKLKLRVEPEYPVKAKTEGIEGVVRFVIVVSSDGSIQSARLLSGHPDLVFAARAALRQWRYEPSVSSDGEAIAVTSVVEVPFVLRK